MEEVVAVKASRGLIDLTSYHIGISRSTWLGLCRSSHGEACESGDEDEGELHCDCWIEDVCCVEVFDGECGCVGQWETRRGVCRVRT
jgi:hypothetical protein